MNWNRVNCDSPQLLVACRTHLSSPHGAMPHPVLLLPQMCLVAPCVKPCAKPCVHGAPVGYQHPKSLRLAYTTEAETRPKNCSVSRYLMSAATLASF
ncbi:hypothetical protein NDU88_007475 [Pleurodeles waltl]|uniref:Uncharacterized protein n=1 Tax=Pleurodeles waltl TaxID=8319 RepID=A0AAV7PTP9_PLEWA|nr:hypothetical protein NDU88_007474 [Pleurodeles waltl]KAJ1129104.1 hypothetical protein NDU88_007475 [Pleurodeles waltl]